LVADLRPHRHGLLGIVAVEGGELARAGPQQIAFAVLSTGRASWAIAVIYPNGVYPSPNSPTPTGFTLLTRSSNQFVTVGSSMLPIAGYQFSLNAPSRAGAKANFIALQAGID
jgi:hypothetical protein